MINYIILLQLISYIGITGTTYSWLNFFNAELMMYDGVRRTPYVIYSYSPTNY